MGRPTVTSKYYSGQGICMMALRDPLTGLPDGGFYTIGNVPELSLSIDETIEEHKEAYTGSRGIDDTLTTETNVNVSITFESIDTKNLVLGLKGSRTVVNSGTGTTASIVAQLFQWVPLSHLNLSSVVVKDVTDTTTYVVDVDYEIDELGGMIRAKSGGAIADGDTLHLTYNHGALVNIQALVQDAPERAFIFNGLNTKDGLPVRLYIPRLQTKAFANLAFINDGIAQFTMEAKALSDPFRNGVGQSKFFEELVATD